MRLAPEERIVNLANLVRSAVANGIGLKAVNKERYDGPTKDVITVTRSCVPESVSWSVEIVSVVHTSIYQFDM